MLNRENIRRIHQQIAVKPAPILSLYLDINPANPSNSGKAYVTRAREAMKALGVPEKVLERALSAMERLPEGRLRVVFAGEDWVEAYDLQTELPLPDGVELRWGEPYLTPLIYALDEYERYAVVLVDREKWRLFELHMGRVEELEGAFRAVAANEWRDLGEDATAAGGRSAGPGAVGYVGRASGGSGKDHFNERMSEWTERFYREMAQRLAEVMKARGIGRLILMGPDPDTKNFAAHLPDGLPEPYILPSMPHSRVGPGEILKALEQQLPPLERAREEKLLDAIRERGIWGLQGVLEALQEGRLHLLVVPWGLEVRVFRCASGRVELTREAAEAYCPGERLEEVSLKEILPALAQAYNVRLEIVRGEAEARLREELGGLAALVRW
ncbi:VLRF1 family aeRF1-type release factor [Calidithermus timidus]|uniref:VLRF1 family aeRF1-type release factor n=1 Tax=Calidithermus timidus TaxID=307124 RepID=UPI0003A03524|nr:VLRF1 family aeRF1-type release factor [Calidithermus timidus]